jgi:hypothetical protein
VLLWPLPLVAIAALAAASCGRCLVANVVEKREVESVWREESQREGGDAEKREREGLSGCARVWGGGLIYSLWFLHQDLCHIFSGHSLDAC